MAFSQADLRSIHEHCHWNREVLSSSASCGCFYCLAIFSPSEIKEWIPELRDGELVKGVTALCPHCGIDSVLPDSVPLSDDLLGAMKMHWFEK